MESKYDPKKTLEEEGEEEVCPPVSPISVSLNSSTISLIILALFELEIPLTEPEALEFLRNSFVPTCKRFSSIMVTDKKGVKRWKKIHIRVEDHLIVSTFPSGLERDGYDEHLKEYMSKIGTESFSEEQPLWEVHLIKYPTLNGAGGSLIFKLSHAIGDGYSFISVMFKAFKRADNPSLPLTFPRLSLRRSKNDNQAGMWKNLLGFLVICKNTSYDLIWNLLKTTVFEDQPSPIRSAGTTTSNKVDLFRPINIYSLNLSLERVKQVKSKLGVTMNDVIIGVISYVIHLYLRKLGQISIGGRTSMTLLVMLNMRIFKGYKNIDEMLKEDAWGNHSRFMHVKIPSFTEVENAKPLDFIIKTKKTMNRKKNAMLYHIDTVLNIARRITGQKGLNQIVHSGFKNATTMVTSVIGPKEQLAIAQSPVSNFYFIVTGVPQSLTFTSVSCMEQLKLVATMEKGFINSQLFTACMEEAFENIFQAAFGEEAILKHSK